ncbi:hypothetical protein ZHAS_00019941 [Anopheles sinensis]|uniref:Uncharacterized protein n=1 Tax=Anopheles sinensis TaxID=74873 RepID=A0A084WNJ5_ANOSI|nr:hypothetical protein ZHAS_00019941 [Anopheles sinensis]
MAQSDRRLNVQGDVPLSKYNSALISLETQRFRWNSLLPCDIGVKYPPVPIHFPAQIHSCQIAPNMSFYHPTLGHFNSSLTFLDLNFCANRKGNESSSGGVFGVT